MNIQEKAKLVVESFPELHKFAKENSIHIHTTENQITSYLTRIGLAWFLADQENPRGEIILLVDLHDNSVTYEGGESAKLLAETLAKPLSMQVKERETP